MPVRTTLTLDEDVAAQLRRESRRSGRPFRELVNDALRTGLERRLERRPAPFVVRATNMGLRKGVSLDSISQLLEQVEGPDHR